MPDLVKVYRKSTGQKLQHPMREQDLRYNPDLAVVPSHRDRRAEAAAADMEDMTVPALRTLAAEQGVEVPSKAVKADVIAAITQPSPDPGEQTQPITDDPQPGSEHEKE